MGKTLIKVDCVDQRLFVSNAPVLASGGKNEDAIEFSFCPLWDGFEKVATFTLNDGEPFHVVISENRCIIPHEVLADEGWMEFGVFGVKDDVTRTSENLKYRVVKGAITEDTKPSDPTPDIYSQIIDLMNQIQANGVTDEQIAEAVEKYLEENPIEGGGSGLPVVSGADDGKILIAQAGGWVIESPADVVEPDNTKPITSAAVYATVGNIEELLKTI